MQWENLTSLNFEKAVQECQGVGILSTGVLEPHSSHLPLGTDMLIAHYTACRAAEIEPAIVFPAYPYTINIEGAHLPGSLVIRRDIAFALLENICDEMGRHGLTKIVIFNQHGGNRFFLPLFVQTLPEKDKPYIVYYADLPHSPGEQDVIEAEETGHACEIETSLMLHIHAETVKMGLIPPRPFTNLRRNEPIAQAGAYSPVDWYAMYPVMYVGDAHKATAEKGKYIMDRKIDDLVRLLRLIKDDRITPRLWEEFLARSHHPASPKEWAE